jgi:hypothetical protein
MIELIQITNDPAFASRCDALDGMRLFVDLERLGKAERQAGRNTFISTHQVSDVRKVKSCLRRSRLMVRVNPVNPGTRDELEAVLDGGADMVMLPMFNDAAALEEFIRLARGRAPVVALLETPGALATLPDWIATPGLAEVYVGLNDLHLALGARFMFEPLADGVVDAVAAAAQRHGLGFGFGGIARLGEGLLSGRDVLAEHLRLGSRAVILSRTFHRADIEGRFEEEVLALRAAEGELARRTPEQVRSDEARIRAGIGRIAAGMGAAG